MPDIVELKRVQQEQFNYIESGWLRVESGRLQNAENNIKIQQLYSDLGIPYHLSDSGVPLLTLEKYSDDTHLEQVSSDLKTQNPALEILIDMATTSGTLNSKGGADTTICESDFSCFQDSSTLDSRGGYHTKTNE